MDNLKECPFCGSFDISFNDDWYDENSGDCMTVTCNNCHVMIQPFTRPLDSDGNLAMPGTDIYETAKRDIIGAWNGRNGEIGLSEELMHAAERALELLRKSSNLDFRKEIAKEFVEIEGLIEKARKQARRKARIDVLEEDATTPATPERQSDAEAEAPRHEDDQEEDPATAMETAAEAEYAEQALSGTRTTRGIDAGLPPYLRTSIAQMPGDEPDNAALWSVVQSAAQASSYSPLYCRGVDSGSIQTPAQPAPDYSAIGSTDLGAGMPF